MVNPATAESGAQGVGKHVTLADQGGKKLLDLIIGKTVKDNPKLHYVRENGKSQIYVVAVSTDKLTTRFDNWIEKDLLKLNSFDIARVFINNYSIDEAQGVQRPGEMLDLTYNDKEGKWHLVDLKEGEELDTAKLNELKTALDDLKIVDVRKKPAGLSRDLKTEEGITLDQETVGSLVSKGFYPTRGGDLLSNQGEVVCATNDGVEYVLRFGEIALGTEQAANESAKKTEGDVKEGEKKDQGANRYLFLMAQFDQERIPKPELQPVPAPALRLRANRQKMNPNRRKLSQQKTNRRHPSPSRRRNRRLKTPPRGQIAPEADATKQPTEVKTEPAPVKQNAELGKAPKPSQKKGT